MTNEPLPPVARALAEVPELLAERDDLDVALDTTIDLLSRHNALGPLPETSTDIAWMLGRLIERAHTTNQARLAARKARFNDMLEAYLSEFGATTLDELRAGLAQPPPNTR